MPYLMLVGVTLIWSTNFIVGKVLVGIPPLFLAAARFTTAGIAMIPIMMRQRTVPPQPVRRTLLLMGITGILFYNPLIYLGLHFTSAINTTLVNSLSPLIMGALSHFWLRERMRAGQIVGLVSSLFGVVWITARGDLRVLLSMNLNPGDLLVLAATACWAVYSVLTRKVTRSISPVQATMWSTWIGISLLIPAAAVEGVWAPLPPLSAPVVAAFVYLGLFPSVIAYFLWTTAISRVGSTQAGMFYNLMPVFGALMAVAFLHESFHAYDWVGSGCILAGILAATIRPRGQVRRGSEDSRSGRDPASLDH